MSEEIKKTVAIWCMCIAIIFGAWLTYQQHEELHCWREAQYARETPRFCVYQSELDRCMAYRINLPAIVSPNYK